MSSESLEAMRQHRLDQVENGAFSQEFTSSDPVAAFRGIYERAYALRDRDQGYNSHNTPTPAILVSEIPDGFKKGTIITTEDGDKRVTVFGKDFEGVPIIWLS